MATKAHKKGKQTTKDHLALITPNMQKVFLVVLILNWLGTLLLSLYFIISATQPAGAGLLAYSLLQSSLPLLYTGIAMPFVWRHYRGTLKRWFMAGATGLLGMISYGGVSQFVSAFRASLVEPNTLYQQDFWSLYGHDVVVTCVFLAGYVAVLGVWDMRLTRRKK